MLAGRRKAQETRQRSDGGHLQEREELKNGRMEEWREREREREREGGSEVRNNEITRYNNNQ
jgi:hypothetical protein